MKSLYRIVLLSIILISSIFFTGGDLGTPPTSVAATQPQVEIGLLHTDNRAEKIEIESVYGDEILLEIKGSDNQTVPVATLSGSQKHEITYDGEEVRLNNEVIAFNNANYLIKIGPFTDQNVVHGLENLLNDLLDLRRSRVIESTEDGARYYLELTISDYDHHSELVEAVEHLMKEEGYEGEADGFDKEHLIQIVKSPVTNYKLRTVDERPIKLHNKDRSYRGILKLAPDSGKWRVTNQLGLEEYLKGVVPAEAYTSWELETLKAQAVIARTYAVYTMGNNKYSHFDLSDGVECQVYAGYDRETDRTTQAVLDTQDVMIYYNNRPINALYHSNSGGATEDSENVWGSEVPYLRSVESPWDRVSLDGGAPHAYEWDKEISHTELSEKLDEAFEIGELLEIKELERTETGRIKKLLYIGKDGEHELFGDSNRRPLDLRSTKFQIESNASESEIHVLSGRGPSTKLRESKQVHGINGAQNISKATPDMDTYFVKGASTIREVDKERLYQFIGNGFGHGLGLSQWGAQGMALEGYHYLDILKHYYSDSVDIR